jgi:hypothetical protein
MTRRETGESHRHVRAVIPARVVRAAEVAGEAAPAEERREPAAAGPRVELVREGGVVRAIDVTCSCGERLRIVCEYET